MNFELADIPCLPPPSHFDVCITFPGGTQVCATDVLNSADPFQVVQSLLAQANTALAPLTPIFDIIDVVEAIVLCVQAIPKSILSINPAPIIQCIPDLVKKLAKVVALVPQLSVPIMILEIIKALILALQAFITRLSAIVVKEAQLAAAVTQAAKPGNAALQPIVTCAQNNLAVDIANLNGVLGPINRLIGLVNIFASLVPGLPQPLIPNLDNLGPDAAAAIEPLATVVNVLAGIANAIPVP